MALLIAAKDVPADCKIRHVKVYSYDDKTEKSTLLRTETPEAKYCWLVIKGGSKILVSGDHHLAPLGAKDIPEGSPIVGQYCKIDPKTGRQRHGLLNVTQAQYSAWKAAGVGGLP